MVCRRCERSGKWPCWMSLKRPLIRCWEDITDEITEIIIEQVPWFFFLASTKGGVSTAHVDVASLAMTEVLSSLNDRSLPLSDKLKVACYLWGHDELLASGKNTFLLQWACQELCQAYSKKAKRSVPLATAGKLWAFLGRLLKAVVEDGRVKDLPSLNKHLFQVIISCNCSYIVRGWGWFYFCRQ